MCFHKYDLYANLPFKFSCFYTSFFFLMFMCVFFNRKYYVFKFLESYLLNNPEKM